MRGNAGSPSRFADAGTCPIPDCPPNPPAPCMAVPRTTGAAVRWPAAIAWKMDELIDWGQPARAPQQDDPFPYRRRSQPTAACEAAYGWPRRLTIAQVAEKADRLEASLTAASNARHDTGWLRIDRPSFCRASNTTVPAVTHTPRAAITGASFCYRCFKIFRKAGYHAAPRTGRTSGRSSREKNEDLASGQREGIRKTRRRNNEY